MSKLEKMYGIESLIQAVVFDQQNYGSDNYRACKQFSDTCIDKMREYEKAGVLCEHKCGYCEKFKWIIDRAKHYAEKTGLAAQEILKSWEELRDYWFLNYYQECNQPKLEGDTRVFASVDEWRKSVGDKGFRCPVCGGISTDPCECNSGLPMTRGKKCDWTTYGLIASGISVYFIKEQRNARIFMPIAWEEKE